MSRCPLLFPSTSFSFTHIYYNTLEVVHITKERDAREGEALAENIRPVT
jgi:hypothetical protein